jgi:RNA polymerase sigma-70 factor (ECF subfamily)
MIRPVHHTPESHADVVRMLRVRAGDRDSFDELVRTHRASVIAHLYRIVRDRSQAEDLTQDVFLRAYRSRDMYVPTAKFQSWLFRIATNVALNWLRDERHERSHIRLQERSDLSCPLDLRDHRPSAQTVLLRREKDQQVRAAVRALSGKQKAAVLLHKFDGMDHEEVARQLGCSTQAVKSLIFRAYENLRADLASLE